MQVFASYLSVLMVFTGWIFLLAWSWKRNVKKTVRHKGKLIFLQTISPQGCMTLWRWCRCLQVKYPGSSLDTQWCWLMQQPPQRWKFWCCICQRISACFFLRRILHETRQYHWTPRAPLTYHHFPRCPRVQHMYPSPWERHATLQSKNVQYLCLHELLLSPLQCMNKHAPPIC